MLTHLHRAVSFLTVPYFGPVSAKPNRKAQGGHCRIEICHCGYQRRVNRNGKHRSNGLWRPPDAPQLAGAHHTKSSPFDPPFTPANLDSPMQHLPVAPVNAPRRKSNRGYPIPNQIHNPANLLRVLLRAVGLEKEQPK